MTQPAPKPTSVWAQLSLSRLKWVVLIAVLAVTAALGGLQAADHVTPVAMDQTYDDGPLKITVHSAALPLFVDGMRPLDPQCRYLTVDATIESVADRSVGLPTALPVIGTEVDCTGRGAVKTDAVLGIHGVPAFFKGATRLRDGQQMVTVEPGFTNEYRLVWAVPVADLEDKPDIAVRMPQMKEFISTFRIAETWGGDPDAYGELPITPGVYE